MKLLTPIALALGLATATLAAPRAADACGGYYPTAEDQVRRAFASEFKALADKPIHAITFLDDGRAQVELRWGERDDRVIAQLASLRVGDDGRWKRAGRSYTWTVWLTGPIRS